MKANVTYFVPAAVLGAMLLVLGCANKAKDCDVIGTCTDGTIDGGNTGGAGNGGNGTGGSSSACKPVCTGTKPVCNVPAKTCVECIGDTDCTSAATKSACNTTTNSCVQCTKDGNCPSATPFCDSGKNVCVECKSSTDCTKAEASLCSSGTCSPCTQDTDCNQISGKNACGNGTCVVCTVSNETACRGDSCDPATKSCTTTPVNSLGPCEACKADSECQGGDPTDGGAVGARCVPMTFNGAAHGNYCLQRGTNGCSNPYQVPTTAASVSGAATEAYCGINQTATTCEAVLDLVASKTCTSDTDCGNRVGGLCKTVGLAGNHCTIPCNTSAECVASPSPGSACTNNTTLPNYCH